MPSARVSICWVAAWTFSTWAAGLGLGALARGRVPRRCGLAADALGLRVGLAAHAVGLGVRLGADTLGLGRRVAGDPVGLAPGLGLDVAGAGLRGLDDRADLLRRGGAEGGPAAALRALELLDGGRDLPQVGVDLVLVVATAGRREVASLDGAADPGPTALLRGLVRS